MKPPSQSLAVVFVTLIVAAFSAQSRAQSIEDIRWKSEGQVREIYGDPESVSQPVGTHATYTIWAYADFSVAFANKKAFHLYKKDSLKKIVLQEDRSN